jgi:hypothetical protein
MADGGRLVIATVGAVQRVGRPVTFPTGGLRRSLYALRLRIENVSAGPATVGDVEVLVVGTESAAVPAELLVELNRLGAGERAEGWLVFELPGEELPERVELTAANAVPRALRIELSRGIEHRHVYPNA